MILRNRSGHSAHSDVLCLTHHPPSFAARPGYSLPSYLPNATTISVPRTNAPRLTDRILRYGLSRLSLATDYQLSSFQLEYEAWRQLRRMPFQAIHLLWADSDWGYLDLFRSVRRSRLFASFHHCSDTLPTAIRHSSRLRAVDCFVLMSETQVEFFLSCGIPYSRIRVVHLGVDTDYFRPSSQAPNDRFQVLAVGSYRRDFPLLLDVCEQLRCWPDIRFDFVIPPAFHYLFQHLENVVCHAGISDDTLLGLYQSASCFLMTCENATANNALLEAMACGLPVVAERIGGIPEYVSQDGSLLTDPRSTSDLATYVISLYENPGLRPAMALASRRRAESLAWPNVASNMQRLYEEVIG